MAKSSPVDRLLAESKRLRDELRQRSEELRQTTDGVRDFTRELASEVDRLRTEKSVQPRDDGDEEVAP